MRTFSGGCHCGALGFSFQTALPVTEWSVRACQCRFCRAHGALSTSDPAGRLTFHVNHIDSLQRYRFGLKTADFLLCSRCGVYVGAQIETPSGAFGIINALALTLPDELPLAGRADYSSETSSGERVLRREQRWTPLTEVVPQSVRARPELPLLRRGGEKRLGKKPPGKKPPGKKPPGKKRTRSRR